MLERRKSFRVEWNSAARIYDLDGRGGRRCIVSNFSNGGARIIGLESKTVPNKFLLRISPQCRIVTCRVVRRSTDCLAVEFIVDAKEPSKVASGRRQKLVSTASR